MNRPPYASLWLCCRLMLGRDGGAKTLLTVYHGVVEIKVSKREIISLL